MAKSKEGRNQLEWEERGKKKKIQDSPNIFAHSKEVTSAVKGMFLAALKVNTTSPQVKAEARVLTPSRVSPAITRVPMYVSHELAWKPV
jgi:uncharacterized lipoprotein YddW (UPF0748 family)